MSAAAASARKPGAAPLPAQALAIGPCPAHAPLLNLFARSHWTLEHEPTINAATERLGRERFAAIFCNAADWRHVVAALGDGKTRPIVIALSENPAKDEWLEAIASHVHFLDANQLSAPELFPLLNHAWRVCSEARR